MLRLQQQVAKLITRIKNHVDVKTLVIEFQNKILKFKKT